MPRQILLIDGDQYLHRGCAATEHETKWDDENHVLVSNEVEAYETVAASIKHLTDHFGHNDLVLCFSGYEKPNFRLQVDPTYKASRVDTRKPMCFWDVRKKLEEDYRSVSFPGLEADDVMGILSTKPGPDDKIIISRDKDMKTIPGKLWDGKTFQVVTEAGADYWHMYQTLVGDASDGYKGCPGIGPKKAEVLLNAVPPGADPDSTRDAPVSSKYRWEVVKKAFIKAGLNEEHALIQARLARILRWSDWDSVKKEPILWCPGS
jgi:Autographiviridae exonuclease